MDTTHSQTAEEMPRMPEPQLEQRRGAAQKYKKRKDEEPSVMAIKSESEVTTTFKYWLKFLKMDRRSNYKRKAFTETMLNSINTYEQLHEQLHELHVKARALMINEMHFLPLIDRVAMALSEGDDFSALRIMREALLDEPCRMYTKEEQEAFRNGVLPAWEIAQRLQCAQKILRELTSESKEGLNDEQSRQLESAENILLNLAGNFEEEISHLSTGGEN